MMIKNKKAQEGIEGEKLPFYIASVLVLSVVLLFIASMIYTVKASSAKIPEGLENFIFIQRFLNSPYCFSYQDTDTGRYFKGIIDWSKFTENNLNYCYDSTNKNVKAFNLKLNNPETNEAISINTKNWEGRVSEEREKKVGIYSKGRFYEGKLTIGVQDAK